jgi:hypothetical protein
LRSVLKARLDGLESLGVVGVKLLDGIIVKGVVLFLLVSHGADVCGEDFEGV